MSELSELLKNTRLEQKKTLQSVSADTKIRGSFLQAIEDGDYGLLPSYLHAYGFVKKYAEYLGLNYEDIKPLFNAECPKPCATPDGENNGASPSDTGGGKGSKSLMIVILLLIVCAVLWFGYRYYIPNNDGKIAEPVAIEQVPVVAPSETLLDEANKVAPLIEPAEPAPIDNVTVVEVVTPTPMVIETLPPLEPSKPIPAVVDTVQYVTFSFTDECWMSILTDSGIAEEFTAVKGTIKRVAFKYGFSMDIGNAAAVSMRYGSQNFNSFGRAGVALKGLQYKLDSGSLVRVINR